MNSTISGVPCNLQGILSKGGPTNDLAQVDSFVEELAVHTRDESDRFERAAEVHADALIIDLEDSVALSDKQKARTAALEYLEQPAGSRLPCALRINAPVTRTGIEDLHSLLESSAVPDYIILPKCDSPGFVSMVRSLLDQAAKETQIIALIESAKGIEALSDIVKSDVRPVAQIGRAHV